MDQPELTEAIESKNEMEPVTNEIEIIEGKCVPKIELSQDSKSFIKLFKEGLPAKVNGKPVVRKYRIECLKSGEPEARYTYYDDFIEGNVKLIFTSSK